MKTRDAVLLTGLAVVPHAPLLAQSSSPPGDGHAVLSQLPARALVAGTPFVSWADAAGMTYADKEVTNPSWAASLAMVLRYWERDLSFLHSSDEETRAWGAFEGRSAAALDELKSYAARLIPVIVDAALTPTAHPLSGALAHLYRASALADRERKAAEAERRARKQQGNRRALGKVTDTLPHDFWIPALGGWGLR